MDIGTVLHAMRDPAAEHRARGKLFIEMDRVGIARNTSEHEDVGLADGARDRGGPANVQVFETEAVDLAEIALRLGHLLLLV